MCDVKVEKLVINISDTYDVKQLKCIYIYIYNLEVNLYLEYFLKAKFRLTDFFSTGTTTHCEFPFCSPLADYSLLAYEVS